MKAAVAPIEFDQTIILQRIATHFGLSVLYSKWEACWFVFILDSAEFKGRVSDSLTLAEAAERLKTISSEMGSLYVLADEARVAKPGSGV